MLSVCRWHIICIREIERKRLRDRERQRQRETERRERREQDKREEDRAGEERDRIKGRPKASKIKKKNP